MAIIGSTDLGDGVLAVTVDHDPETTATDAPAGSLIIDAAGEWFRKLDDGSTTNVQPSVSGGVTVGSSWKFDTGIADANPGSKRFRFDDVTQADAAFIFVNIISDSGVDMSTVLLALSAGSKLYIQEAADSARFQLFNVTGDPTDATTYIKIPVSSDSSGADLRNNKVCGWIMLLSGASAHALGGASHTADTLANVNTKISDADIIDRADIVPQAEAEAGVATTPRIWTAERMKQAVDAIGFLGTEKSEFFASIGNDSFGNYQTRRIASNSATELTFNVPANFITLISVKVIIIPEATAAGKNIDIFVDFGAEGEQSDNHTGSDLDSTYDFVSGEVFGLDLTALFALLAAGDVGGILLDHKAIGQNVNYLGTLLTYK